MNISDRDRQTSHAIATLLGVELEPWQDFLLQHLLAGYRRPDPPEVRQVEVAEGLCGEVHPPSGARCIRTLSEHTVTNRHEAIVGETPTYWLSRPEPCGEQMPGAALITATCSKPAGHRGKHVVGAGDLTGSTWHNLE